jgi:hypothetical protein
VTLSQLTAEKKKQQAVDVLSLFLLNVPTHFGTDDESVVKILIIHMLANFLFVE